jgi:hypothetical protein
MTNERVLIIEEVQHAEESHLVQLYEFLVDVEEIFVFVARESPEVRKALNGRLFIRRAVSAERPLDCICKLIGEILAEPNN